MEFCESYSSHFVQQGMNSVHHARCYLTGLLGTQRRKNIETIENDVAESDYQGMEQFISSSPWKHEPLMDQLAQDIDGLIGSDQEAALIIDESSFLKKGSSSVGVQRQWSGRAGKVENCQVGVFAALANGERMALCDFRLFLPESWAGDEARCQKAKIPLEHRRHQPKWQQALEMVAQARQRGMRFGWVGADSLYGATADFINGVEELGEKFVADVHVSNRIWTQEPLLEKPLETGSKGKGWRRHRDRLSAENQARYISVKEWAEAHFEAESREIVYRKGTKGPLKARIWISEVWTWEPSWKGGPRRRMLIVRQDGSGNMKYSLTNFESGLAWERYGYLQGQRFWVEHAFHEAKSHLGMAQYQVRVWRGWHHHMALSALAMLFLLKEQIRTHQSTPLLSARDVTELLNLYLPRRAVTEEEVLQQIATRHRKRQRDIERRSRIKENLTK